MYVYSADDVKDLENKLPLLSSIAGTMKLHNVQIHPTDQGILVKNLSNETATQVAFLGRTADSLDDGIFSCFFSWEMLCK